MTFYSLNKGKDAHITEPAARPIYNTKSFGNWNPRAEMNNVSFFNFKTSSKCNGRISIIGMPDIYQPDYTPTHYFRNCKFTNVAKEAVAFLRDPPLAWASVNDCGEWPCTGPSNAVFNFYDSVWAVNDGVTALPDFWTAGTTKYSFQVLGKITSAGETYPNCKFSMQMNAYFCADPAQTKPPQIGVLLFESLDGDRDKRNLQPVVITNGDGYKNVLNKFMDHDWDGFYTSLKRLNRYPAQVQTGKAYTVTFTGTPPSNMRFVLRSDAGTAGVTVKIPYPNAGSYNVAVNGVIIPMNNWDSNAQTPIPIDPATAKCGTNRYVGV